MANLAEDQVFALSEEQRAAVESTDAQLTLIAGAGSGKTRVLVATYLNAIVNQDITPDRILAVTYTRKAAAEMKKRIVERLRSMGRYRDAQVAETGPIQTFHSFCERMLRENALAAGIDPEFKIAKFSDFSEFFPSSLGAALERQSERHSEVRELIGRLAFQSEWSKPREIHTHLAGDIRDLLDKLQNAGWTPDDLERDYGSTEKVLQAWASRLLLTQPDSVIELVQGTPPASIFEQVEIARKGLGLPPVAPCSNTTLLQSAQETFALTTLAVDTWRELRLEHERRQEFSFSELEARGVRLLLENKSVREKLQRQYSLIMVDEAQDLNPVQYKLLDALSGTRTILIGDPQQSIYGFRHADRSLLVKRSDEVAKLSLSKNYRSHESLLLFIDEFFSSLWNDEYRTMLTPSDILELKNNKSDHFEGVEIWELKQADPAQVAHWVAELIREGTPARDIAVLSRRNNASQALSLALQRHGVESRVVGKTERFYTRLEIRDLANALQALSSPDDRIALTALLLGPMVGLSLDAVVLLSDEPDLLKALPEFSSPVPEDAAKIVEFLRWFVPLSAYADRIPAWEVYSELLARTDYLSTLMKRPLGDQMVANVRKLLVLATKEPKISAREFAEYIRAVQEIKHKEAEAPVLDEDGDAVTLITLHSVKGLEFPVVVLNELAPFKQRKEPSLEVNAGLGMVVASYSQVKTPYVIWLRNLKRMAEHDEEMRLLYVGMTRAMKRLCIVNHKDAEGVSQSAVAKAFITNGVPAPGIRVRTPNSGTVD